MKIDEIAETKCGDQTPLPLEILGEDGKPIRAVAATVLEADEIFDEDGFPVSKPQDDFMYAEIDMDDFSEATDQLEDCYNLTADLITAVLKDEAQLPTELLHRLENIANEVFTFLNVYTDFTGDKK